MPKYRFYNLEQNGKVVVSRIHLMLASDDIAIGNAQKLTIGESVEVWQGDRLVADLAVTGDVPDAAV
jgi:hypothetical protein